MQLARVANQPVSVLFEFLDGCTDCLDTVTRSCHSSSRTCRSVQKTGRPSTPSPHRAAIGPSTAHSSRPHRRCGTSRAAQAPTSFSPALVSAAEAATSFASPSCAYKRKYLLPPLICSHHLIAPHLHLHTVDPQVVPNPLPHLPTCTPTSLRSFPSHTTSPLVSPLLPSYFYFRLSTPRWHITDTLNVSFQNPRLSLNILFARVPACTHSNFSSECRLSLVLQSSRT